MSIDFPKLSVVIPTKDRADTLLHTLRTVTKQNYKNLEIIISDNASLDNTKEIVMSYTDERIKYNNTRIRLGMSENWEYGLSLVTGDYVMFLGDDDGLLPEACKDVAALIKSTGTEAIIWNKPNYTWPSVNLMPNRLDLKCSYDLIEMRGNIILKAVASGKTSYGRLPVLYSGFVSTDIIRKIKNVSNNFFNSVTPDVYSGIVLAHELETYLYSMRPFSINGGSEHSNGISSKLDSKKAKVFFEESNLEIHKKIPLINGSIQSCIAESFLQASDRGLVGNNKLNINKIKNNIYNDLKSCQGQIKIDGLIKLKEINLPKKLYIKVDKEIQKEIKNIDSKNIILKKSYSFNINSKENGKISFNCDNFSVKNSYDACMLVGNILGNYMIPKSINKFNYYSVTIYFIRKYIKNKFKKYFLNF